MIKNIYKKISLAILLAFFLFTPFIAPVLAENNEKEIIFFGSPTCPHCIKERQFLDELNKTRDDLKINEYVFQKILS